MAASASTLRMLFVVLWSMYAALFVYGFWYDLFMSCLDPQARWVQYVLVNVVGDLGVMAAWILYKEDFSRVQKPFVASVVCFIGSVSTCAYLARQFFKLSPEESSKDPIYFVLARSKKGDDKEHRSCSPATAVAIFGASGIFMLGYLIYTLIVDGSPFRQEVATMCMVGTLPDLLITSGVISMWVAYKESSWIRASVWTVILFSSGSIGTFAYLVLQLSYLSPDQPVSSILFKNNNSDMYASDPSLRGGKKLK